MSDVMEIVTQDYGTLNGFEIRKYDVCQVYIDVAKHLDTVYLYTHPTAAMTKSEFQDFVKALSKFAKQVL